MKSLNDLIVKTIEYDPKNKKQILSMIKDNPYNIYFLPKEQQTIRLQKVAVENDEDSLFHIEEPSLEVILYAIGSTNESILTNVDTANLSEEYKMEIIKNYPRAIIWIRKPSKELCMLAINESKYDEEIVVFCAKYLINTEYEQEILDNLAIKDIIE